MNEQQRFQIIDVTDESAFGHVPPCIDPGFDHRSCDYWEDEVRGSKAARPSWWQVAAAPAKSTQPTKGTDNPFQARQAPEEGFNPFSSAALATALDPFAGDDLFATPAFNPFAPDRSGTNGSQVGPRKLRLLTRGVGVFGSYAKVLLSDGRPAAYAQFGPLSAYPRAQTIRDLYPRLPQSPLPAVITCIATTSDVRGQGLAGSLIGAVCEDLATRGFAAVEAYPDLTLRPHQASSAHPAFWVPCGFDHAVQDERYPVMRRQLD